MKTMHILIITVLVFSTLLYVKPIQADNENGIKIQNIQTLPTAIIIGQTFKINATLINNSTTPIFIERGSCGSPFSVTFDNHVVVRTNNVTCTLQLLVQRLDPGTKITSTSPYLDLTYVAAENGTVNATVSFPYNVWNQTSQSNTKVNVSKPFSFMIYPKTRVPALSTHDNQAIINVALSIPDLQKWSNDWKYAYMDFMTAKNQPGNWQYAIVYLKASSSSSLIPCDNGWDAMVTIDRTTMKVISATYPTIESHNCDKETLGGGLGTYGGTIQKIESPLKQFKSGVAAKDVMCKVGLQLIIKSKDNSPACVKPDTAQKLAERGWTKGPRGVSALANPPVSLFNVTTSPQPIILGEPFVIKATVVNHESVPITFYGGCAFPLSASFDDSIMTYPYSTMHCLAMSENVIEPNGTAVIYSDKMGTRYNSSGTGVTSAMLTFRYESDGKQASFTMSKQFTTSPAQTLQERWVQNKHGASPCDMPYHPQNTGIPVLFMPTNSIGKVCVNYSNGNDPTTVTPRVFGAQNLSHDTQDISVSPLQANVVHGNSTIVYTITSGNKTGFYGLTIFCYGTPIAVGYDNQSRIVTGDFPWLHQTFYCPLQSYNYHIVGVGGGMGIKYVPP